MRIFRSPARLFAIVMLTGSLVLMGQAPTQSATPAPTQAKAKKAPPKDPINDDGPILGDVPTYKPPSAKSALKPAVVPAWLTELVAKQFGSAFEIFPGDPQVLYTGDFDGDGVEDAVIVVRSKHPLAGEVEFNYKSFSPEDDYYGYGNAKIMSNTEFMQWEKVRMLLIIHGAGEQAWKADVPKAKYVIINMPFEKISITKSKLKKKEVSVISGDSKTFSGVIFWDGKKKYKFVPGDTVD